MPADKRHTTVAMIGMGVAALLIWCLDDEPAPTYFQNEGKVFGTYYNIRYESTGDLHDSIRTALASFDGSMSLFNPCSVLSAVNANRDTVTDAPFEQMWEEASRVYELSGGAFDITVAPLVKAFGFGRKSDQFNNINRHMIDSLRAFVGFDRVRLENHRVIKTDPRIQIDCGAVAKGQACDMIADMLRRNGCRNLLVDIGGEVVCEGVNAKGAKWRVGITKPNLNNEGAQDELQEIVETDGICMATSGNYRNYYYEDGERRSHTIDPRTGWPVQHSVLSATVVSSTCMRADAFATACMVLGADEALDMINRAGDAACYLIVAENDRLNVICSPEWDKMTAK